MLGAAAGAFTGMVTTPLDVARTAEVCAAAAGVECRGASCLAALVQRGGPGVLLRGAAPRMLEISLGGAIYFSALEAAAITVAPIAFAIWTVARPTPPAAPRTRIVSPFFRSARCLRA